MKKLISTLLLAAVVTATMAIPAKRVTRTVTINGKTVTLTLRGDENLHYWQAEDGATYRLTDNQKVETIDLSKARENIQLRQTAQMKEAAAVASTPDGMRRASKIRRTLYSGTRRGLVILANFKDKQFSITNPQETYQSVMSEEGYTGNGQYGSVRDYFKAQSYGQFDFVMDVVGPVTLSNNMSYYGANTSEGNDIRPAHMAKEACQLADAAGVDFSQYDWDGDGTVEQVFIIYAGYGEAQGAPSTTIWPHAWVIEGSGGNLYLDGKRISSYACGSELTGTSGKKMDGIGTICHEFSHCFGLPDFYCTDYNHDELTMSYWSLMDHGSYSNSGYTPTAYTAYERWFCGWMEPKELNEPQTVTALNDIETEGDAYILYNQKNSNEYYIMYNVQQTGWNSAAMGHGMMVLHVDYSSSAWKNNNPNNDASHLRMTPICADNERGTKYAKSFAGDPYPGTKKNTSLTDTSTPAATLFNANKDGSYYMGKPIEEITEKNGVISFLFDGGVPDPDVPINVAIEKYDTGFNVSWDESANASTYDVEYGIYDQDAEEKAITYLDLDMCFNCRSDGTKDISSTLDDSLSVKGCTGSKLFYGKADNGLKMGSSSTKGFLNTPALNFAGDSVEVTFTASPYSATSTSTIAVIRLDATGAIMEAGKVFTISSSKQTFTTVLSTEGMSMIRIGGPDGRVYLSKLVVKDHCNPYIESGTIDEIEDTSIDIEPDPLQFTKYYARVRAVNSRGVASQWSDYQIVSFEKPEPEYVLGDVNGDGKVDAVDVTTLIGYIIGEELDSFVIAAADVSGDGNIDVLDVTSLIDIILSK